VNIPHGGPRPFPHSSFGTRVAFFLLKELSGATRTASQSPFESANPGMKTNMLHFFNYNESQNTRWNLLLHAPSANIRKWKSFRSIGAYFFMSVKTARLFFALSPAIAASFVHLVLCPVRPPKIRRK
jgi:hypothetical protein